MHAKLTADGRKLSDEIRRRLQKSLDDEQPPSDPKTDELLDGIKQIAGNLDQPWHDNQFSWDVFKAAIIELLSSFTPSGNAQPGAAGKFKTMYGPDVKPQIIANILAHVAIKELEKKRAKQSLLKKQSSLNKKRE